MTKSAKQARKAVKVYGDALRASRLAAIDAYAVAAYATSQRAALGPAPRLLRADLPPSIARAWAKLEAHGDVVALGIVGRVVVLGVQRADGVRARIFYRWAGEASILRADGAIVAGRAMTMTAALAELETAATS